MARADTTLSETLVTVLTLLCGSGIPFLITGMVTACLALALSIYWEKAISPIRGGADASELDAARSTKATRRWRWIHIAAVAICFVPSLLPASIVFSTLRSFIHQMGLFPKDIWLAGFLAIVPALPLACIICSEVFRPFERLRAARALAVNVSQGAWLARATLYAAHFAKPIAALVLLHFIFAHFHAGVANQTATINLGSYILRSLQAGSVSNGQRLLFAAIIVVLMLAILALPMGISLVAHRLMVWRMVSAHRNARGTTALRPDAVHDPHWMMRALLVTATILSVATIVLIGLRLIGIVPLDSDGRESMWDGSKLAEALYILADPAWLIFAAFASLGSAMVLISGPSWMRANLGKGGDHGVGAWFVVAAAVAFSPFLTYGLVGQFLVDGIDGFAPFAVIYVHAVAFLVGVALAVTLAFGVLFGRSDIRVVNARLAPGGVTEWAVGWLAGLRRILLVVLLSANLAWTEDGLRRAFGETSFAAHFYNQQGGYPPVLRLQALMACVGWFMLIGLFIAGEKGLSRVLQIRIRRRRTLPPL